MQDTTHIGAQRHEINLAKYHDGHTPENDSPDETETVVVWTDADGTPSGLREVIGTVTDRTQLVYIDAEGAAGQAYRYDVVQVVDQIGDEVSSNPANASPNVRLDFDGVILGAVTDPEGFHIDLRYSARRGEEGEWDWDAESEYFRPLSGALPVAIPGKANAWHPSGQYRLHTDSKATSLQRYVGVQDLASRKGTITYRDGRGEVRYVMLTRVQATNTPMLNAEVRLQFREVARDVIDATGGAVT